VERDLQVLGVRRWRELVTDRKNGGTLFDRPKPKARSSANGRKRRRNVWKIYLAVVEGAFGNGLWCTECCKKC
jgi:hypothetical protein